MTDNGSDINNIINLKLVGFSDLEKSRFQSILDLSENRLDTPWQTITTIEADFYLISYRLRPQMDSNDLLRSFPRARCIFYATKETGSQEHELIVAEGSLPSLRSLVSLFNTLSSSLKTNEQKHLPQPAKVLEKANPAVPKKNISPSKATEIYFDPKQGLIGQLLANQSKFVRFNLVNQNNSTILFVDFEKKVYYCSNQLDQLDVFFADSATSTEVLKPLFQHEIAAHKLTPNPLNHLVWFAVFSQSQGHVKKGYNPSDIVHLKRWPDINIPGCRDLIKLAAYMHSNASELSVAQEKTGYSIQQIYNFYNACDAIGLIKHSQKTDILEKKVDKDQQQLFLKISDRLNIAKSS